MWIFKETTAIEENWKNTDQYNSLNHTITSINKIHSEPQPYIKHRLSEEQGIIFRQTDGVRPSSLVCDISWSSMLEVFSRYSGYSPPSSVYGFSQWNTTEHKFDFCSVKINTWTVPLYHVTHNMLHVLRVWCVSDNMHTPVPWQCVCMLETIPGIVRRFTKSQKAPSTVINITIYGCGLNRQRWCLCSTWCFMQHYSSSIFEVKPQPNHHQTTPKWSLGQKEWVWDGE